MNDHQGTINTDHNTGSNTGNSHWYVFLALLSITTLLDDMIRFGSHFVEESETPWKWNQRGFFFRRLVSLLREKKFVAKKTNRRKKNSRLSRFRRRTRIDEEGFFSLERKKMKTPESAQTTLGPKTKLLPLHPSLSLRPSGHRGGVRGAHGSARPLRERKWS